jgi:hypothetical protein
MLTSRCHVQETVLNVLTILYFRSILKRDRTEGNLRKERKTKERKSKSLEGKNIKAEVKVKNESQRETENRSV